MKLPKVPALKCESIFDEIAYIKSSHVGPPNDESWIKLAFSITDASKMHENCLEYPFVFSGQRWSAVKPIMSNCVSTFRNYSIVTAMASLWNQAASRTFGTRECMQELSKVFKWSHLLGEQNHGNFPDNHPLVHKEIQSLILALVNIRAISIMSSDDALTEEQCFRRFGVRCEIWRLLQKLDSPFWERFANQLIQEQKQALANLYIKVALRFSRWQQADLGDVMAEAKMLIPYSTVPEKKAFEVRILPAII